jgi:hypothetical protein
MAKLTTFDVADFLDNEDVISHYLSVALPIPILICFFWRYAILRALEA